MTLPPVTIAPFEGRSVCLFCGASDGNDPAFAQAAAAVGRASAEQGWRLVYGGGGVGLMGASPGGYGGIRMLPVLRFFLATNFAMHVVPEQLALGFAADAFESDIKLKAEPMQQMLERVAASVARTARAIIASDRLRSGYCRICPFSIAIRLVRRRRLRRLPSTARIRRSLTSISRS